MIDIGHSVKYDVIDNSSIQTFKQVSKGKKQMNIDRISRALNQPLFLIHTVNNEDRVKYVLSGLTSTYNIQLPPCSDLFDGKVNTYDDEKLMQSYPLTNCKLDNVSCTCPDFQNRHSACKHIFFILLKVLKVHPNVNLSRRNYWQHGQRSQIKRFIQVAKSILNHEVPSNCKRNEDCSICLDEFNTPNNTTDQSEIDKQVCYCHGCGYKFHSICISVWTKTQPSRKKSCPLCRYKFN